MYKLRLNYILTAFAGIVLLASCKTVTKSHTADYDYMYINKQGIKQRPLVTDLEVAATKVTITKTYTNVSVTEAKENALGDFVEEQKCDLVVQPYFETSSVSENEKKTITVTLMGYPAFYRNIRNFEPKDTASFLIRTFSNNISVPMIAPAVAEAPKTTTENSSVFQKVKSGKNTFGVGVDYNMPTGNFGDYYKSAIGYNVNLMYPKSKQTAITVTANYASFAGKDFGFFSYSKADFIAAKFGFRYTTDVKVFIEPQFGYALLDDESGLNYALNVGYSLTKNVDVSAKYEKIAVSGGFSFIGLKVGFNF